MICTEKIKELVECARRGASAGLLSHQLRAHLAVCGQCRDRWEAERQLSAEFRAIRVQTAELRSSEFGRAALMREFSMVQRQRRPAMGPMLLPSWARPSWGWKLSAAAAVILAIFVGHEAGRRPAVTVSPVGRTHALRTAQTVLYEASADADALSSDDFVAVPYTPPLAPGEMVRVVRTELYPEALANMGVEVDPLWAGQLPADVVVGEDGLPRAVRLVENGQF